jgi:hypothetical protein
VEVSFVGGGTLRTRKKTPTVASRKIGYGGISGVEKKQPHSYNEEEHLRASHYLKAEKVYPHHRDVCVYLYMGMIPLLRRNNVSCLIRIIRKKKKTSY